MTLTSLAPGRLTLVRQERSRGGFGRPARMLQQHVEAPAGAADRTAYELWVARRAFDLLDEAYPGHLWFVDFDLARGGMCVSIPLLTGGNWAYFIRQRDLTPRRVVRAGGELLERYGLARGALRVDQFVAARDRRSILAGRASKVPG
jgi:hypothetical protein